MIRKKDIVLRVDSEGINQLVCHYDDLPENCTCAWYIYKDGKVITKYGYQKKTTVTYWAVESGEYQFKVFVKDDKGESVSNYSEKKVLELSSGFYSNVEKKSSFLSIFLNVWYMLQEIWVHRKRMYRISLYDYRVLNKDSYLGTIWNILNPLIQVATFWFVFGVGLKSGNDVEGYPYIVWLLCGMIPWFYISACITQGAGAIKNKGMAALKMRYPIATMPAEAILVCFYSHVVMMGILVLTLLFFGVYPNLYWLNIVYYLIYAFVFYTALATITSVLTMIASDFRQLITSLIRLLFYVTPILWNITRIDNKTARFVLKLNPVLYYVDGFRDSLLYHTAFYEHPAKIGFFWAINLVLLLIGANLQAKYKNQFLDME